MTHPPVTDDQLLACEAVAPKYSDALIADTIFDCAPAEFVQLKVENPRIADVIRRGRSLAQQKLSDALYSQALAGNVDAIRYLEQTRYGVSP